MKLRDFEEKSVLFMSVNKAKFRKPVTPGCKLLYKIYLITSKKSLYKFRGEAFVEEKLVASSEFSAMLVDKEKAK